MAEEPSPTEVHRAEIRLRSELDRYGLLLAHDVLLPSATRCVAGESIRGSWWGHPMGKLIYKTLQRIEGDVARVKLVGQKSTLVHRKLWPALAAVARSAEDWQTAELDPDALEILRQIRQLGRVRTNELQAPSERRRGELVKELEWRLLVFSKQEHTSLGRHVNTLIPFELWQRDVDIADAELPDLKIALEALTAPVRAWVGERAAGLLPWPVHA